MFCSHTSSHAFTDTNALDLSPKILNALRRSGMNNCKAILLSSLSELAQVTKLSRLECQQVLNIASRATLKSSFIACSNLRFVPRMHLSTGCPILDKFLQGGFRFGGITEISGESASGKTQICLQLSVFAQLPTSEGGLCGSVAYICTEDAFPIKRLHQIIQEVQKQYVSLNNTNVTDNIFVNQVGDAESLKTCIQKTLPQLVSCRNIKLVILDSVAAVFRSDYDLDQNIQRSRDIQSIGYCLHQLSAQYKIIVLCVNQVTDSFEKHVHSSYKKHVPSLGLTWSNLVTTRIMVSRTQRRTEVYKKGNCHVKLAVPAVIFSMHVEFSPSLPSNIQAQFIVTPYGVFGLTS